MEEQVAVVDHENQEEAAINKVSKSETEEETLMNLLDSLDDYLLLIDSLSNTLLRQGWMELAGARYSMGGSRVNTALLNLQPHSAATTVEVTHDQDGSIMTKSPKFNLCKWASPDNKDSSLEKENIEEDEQLKENISNQSDSGNQESSPDSSIGSVTNGSQRESNGSEINASPRKIENPGWLELAGARYSMGASRVNTALLNLQPHSAATTVEVTHDENGSIMTKSPKFNLCKWASPDNKDSSLEKENIEEDEQLKENISSQSDSGNQESSPESSIESVTNASPRESNGSEINASPRKIENLLQKERAKVLSMFGTLVSPKLRASQLTFETALETLVEIANARSSILKSYEALHRDMKSTKE